VKRAQEEEKRKISEYHDVDQFIQEQSYDHKGNWLSLRIYVDVEYNNDSDEELDAIIETDTILKEFYENPTEASHTKIIKLFKNFQKMEDLLDLGESPKFSEESEGNSELMEILRTAISPQIPLFADINEITSLAQIGFNIGLPSEPFWDSISHLIAVSHQEIDIDTTLKLTYLLYRHDQESKIKVIKNYIEGNELDKERMLHRLNYSFVIGNLRKEIDKEIEEIEISTAFRMIDYLYLLYLNNITKLDLFVDELSEEKVILYLESAISGRNSIGTEFEDENALLNEYIDNLNQFTKDFKLIHLFDLLHLIDIFKETLRGKPDLLKFIVYQIIENMKEPDFYQGCNVRSKK